MTRRYVRNGRMPTSDLVLPLSTRQASCFGSDKPRQLVQDDCGRGRDVDRIGHSVHGNRNGSVRQIDNLLRDPGRFRAEDYADREDGHQVLGRHAARA
jgi:hypothetical protein